MSLSPKEHTFSFSPGPWAAAAVLILAAAGIYFGVWQFDFVNFDDPLYVTANRHVRSGLSAETIRWAFTDATAVTNYWAPLTWISFLIDFELYGTHAGGYHLTNLLLHIANTLLLFRLLRAMTGALWKSAFVAALFCVHPLHVESVAWVTERKDVLSTLFWFLTMAAYAAYARRPGPLRYLATAASLLLGLMAKPMLVTLPFALLLLDWWPLHRLQRLSDGRALLRLVGEKIPFFMMIAVVGFVAFAAQKAGGAVKSTALYPMDVRTANVLIAYLWYLYKTLWPAGLAVVYPYPAAPSAATAALCGFLLLAASVGAVAAGRRFRYLPVGWFWYLGTLVPVIGWVVIGQYAVADRYSYVPLTGIFIIVAWGASDLLSDRGKTNVALPAAALASLMALSATAFLQVRHWQDSVTLFEHALSVTEGNFQAHNNLGRTLSEQGRIEEAQHHFERALQIQPGYRLARMNLATIQARTGKPEAALENFRKVLAAAPRDVPTLYNLARLLVDMGEDDRAESFLRQAIELDPDHVDALRLLSVLSHRRGKMAEAESYIRRALALAPGDVQIQVAAGELLMARGKAEEGGALVARAISESLSAEKALAPEVRRAIIHLCRSLAAQGKTDAARQLVESALRADPQHPDLVRLQRELAEKGS